MVAIKTLVHERHEKHEKRQKTEGLKLSCLHFDYAQCMSCLSWTEK